MTFLDTLRATGIWNAHYILIWFALRLTYPNLIFHTENQITRGILQRIDRLRLGNFGDCKSVGSGVYELRIHFGPGFRVYFGLEGDVIVLLLCGGDKSTQKKDIANAHTYWKEFKENEK